VCLFSGLGAIGLVGPDEPRYAAIARAMAKTHDWVTPRLWGSPWFEKPVLYYWCAGIAMRIFGVSEFAARLPSALAALLSIVAVKWAALRNYGVGTAWFALLMLPSSVAMIGFARAASPDMLFAGLLTACMAVALEMLQKPRPGPMLRIAFGFALGAAVLAKGPAAVILAGGATLLWAALSRQWLAPFRFLHPLVIVAFCVTALPWYILCALRNPDFLRVFIWQHNFERYLTPVFQHPQPVWFYVPILLTASFPWVVMATSPACMKWSVKGWQSSPGLFIFSWALFPFLFFSFSQSKLPGYVLPCVPPAFVLLGRAVSSLFESNRRRFAISTGGTGAMFLAAAPASAGSLLNLARIFKIPRLDAVVLLVLAALGGLLAIGLSLAKKPMSAVISLAALIAVILPFMNIAVLPLADSRLSSRSAARESFRLNPSGEDVMVFGLSRESRYGIDYYFDRDLPEWVPGAPLPEWLITTQGDVAEFERFRNEYQLVGRAGEPMVVLLRHSPRPEASR
jgi:hypothetical protein